MRVLIMAGLGPYARTDRTFEGTLLAREVPAELMAEYARMAGRPVDLGALRCHGRAMLVPHPELHPSLPGETVRWILERAGVDHEVLGLEALWGGTADPRGDFDVVGLSTTFLCDFGTLRSTLAWITRRFPAAVVVLGGQFSNLKYAAILEQCPEVDYVVRGDAEEAFPALLQALQGKKDLAAVPNLVFRGPGGALQLTPFEYADLEAWPSPRFRGPLAYVPYESMRGCPFSCRYCSYPAASPKWRYKSAEKIVADWTGYAESHGGTQIKALDSTFTVPPPRLRRLLELLPRVGVPWVAYSRANVLDRPELVEALEAACCQGLQVGMESMSDSTLRLMNKKVSAAQNRRAVDLLRSSRAIYLGSTFIVGYPGETPEEYRKTHDYLLDGYRGRFNVFPFSLVDETMPVWEDAATHRLEVEDPWTWRHSGMDSDTATALRFKTLEEVRWKSEDAVLHLWQERFDWPLAPHLDVAANLRLEKLVERLAFARKDRGPDAGALCRRILEDLERLGVEAAVPA